MRKATLAERLAAFSAEAFDQPRAPRGVVRKGDESSVALTAVGCRATAR